MAALDRGVAAMVVHTYRDGRAAAYADGWCTMCFRAEPMSGLMVCADCREKRNLRGRQRNAARPKRQRTLGDMQTLFGR